MTSLTVSDTLYESIGERKKDSLETDVSLLGRWERLLENKDDLKSYSAIKCMANRSSLA